MRYSLIPIVIILLIFTQGRIQAIRVNKQELPNDTLINEVISSVILIDSLNGSNLGTQRIIIPDIYFLPIRDKNAPTPPPPPSYFGYTFEEILEYFNPLNDTKQRLLDSNFIVRQIDTTINHKIFASVSSLFQKENDYYYYFSLPIFSYDMKTVIIAYSQEFHFGCFTVLRKVDDNWLRVDHELTWMQ
ncbi:MAG: hypothetical protein IPN08_19765 [Bacteroidales bacterium]|nr:hypothetical protein [Bacteroidales bacterium]